MKSIQTRPESAPYVPTTEAEKAEAFRLHEKLLNELAKEDAIREVVGKALEPTRKGTARKQQG